MTKPNDSDQQSLRVVLEVRDGPMEGSAFIGDVRAVTIGRSSDNAFVLDKDATISRQHARLIIDARGALLEDRNSSSGTYLHNRRIEGREPIEPGDLFLVGHTPVEFLTRADAARYHQHPSGELALALKMFSDRSKEVLDLAGKAALKSGCPWIGPVHVLCALLEFEDPQIASRFQKKEARCEKLLDEARCLQRWTGQKDWIQEAMRNFQQIDCGLDRNNPIPTPKLDQILCHARVQVLQDKREIVEPRDLFDSLCRLGRSAATDWLEAKGLAGTAGEHAAGSWTGDQTSSSVTVTGQKMRKRSALSVEEVHYKGHDAWITARKIADQVTELQSAMRFEDVEKRMRQISALIQHELAGLSPEYRFSVLTHIQSFFPVREHSSNLIDQIAMLEEEIRKLKSAEPQKKAPPAPVLSLAEILSGDSKKETDPNALMIRQLYDFALAMESLIAGIVQSLISKGTEVTHFVIPPFQRNLNQMLAAASQGPKTAEEVRAYLDTLKRWMIASYAGYHKACGRWSRELAERLDPDTIKGSVPKGMLRFIEKEAWEKFEVLYREIDLGHSEIIEDQVMDLAARIAQEEFIT